MKIQAVPTDVLRENRLTISKTHYDRQRTMTLLGWIEGETACNERTLYISGEEKENNLVVNEIHFVLKS